MLTSTEDPFYTTQLTPKDRIDPPPRNSGNDSGLSQGAIIAIAVIAAVVAVGLIGGVTYWKRDAIGDGFGWNT